MEITVQCYHRLDCELFLPWAELLQSSLEFPCCRVEPLGAADGDWGARAMFVNPKLFCFPHHCSCPFCNASTRRRLSYHYILQEEPSDSSWTCEWISQPPAIRGVNEIGGELCMNPLFPPAARCLLLSSAFFFHCMDYFSFFYCKCPPDLLLILVSAVVCIGRCSRCAARGAGTPKFWTIMIYRAAWAKCICCLGNK